MIRCLSENPSRVQICNLDLSVFPKKRKGRVKFTKFMYQTQTGNEKLQIYSFFAVFSLKFEVSQKSSPFETTVAPIPHKILIPPGVVL